MRSMASRTRASGRKATLVVSTASRMAASRETARPSASWSTKGSSVLRWIMVELGEHCHTHIIPRMKKVVDAEDPSGITEA